MKLYNKHNWIPQSILPRTPIVPEENSARHVVSLYTMKTAIKLSQRVTFSRQIITQALLCHSAARKVKFTLKQSSNKIHKVHVHLGEPTSLFSSSPSCKVTKDSQGEFSAVMAPTLSRSWFPNRYDNDRGL